MTDAAGLHVASEFGTHSKAEMANRYPKPAVARWQIIGAKAFNALVRRA